MDGSARGPAAWVEGTRRCEGDEVVAVVPGSTLDHVVFFADDGTAYTMRMKSVPASSGYGEPITKFFRLADQVRGGGGHDRRAFHAAGPTAGQRRAGRPYLLVVTAQGQTLRTPLTPFRTASTKVGRRLRRLADGDKVVLATVLKPDIGVFLASGKGTSFISRSRKSTSSPAWARALSASSSARAIRTWAAPLIPTRMMRWSSRTSGGKQMEFYGSREMAGRGGKGFEAVERTTLVPALPRPIELVNWDEVEGPGDDRERKANGDGQRTLFE